EAPWGAAEAGVPVTWDIVLAVVGRLREIEALSTAAAMLLRDGRPPALIEDGAVRHAQQRIDTSQLADTLRAIARHGAAGFYRRWVAEAIEREVRAGGGVLTTEDPAGYEPKIVVEPGASYR